jgi:hypothetical protein
MPLGVVNTNSGLLFILSLLTDLALQHKFFGRQAAIFTQSALNEAK